MFGTRRKVSLESLILKVPDHILDQPCTDRDQNSRELLFLVSQQTNLHGPALGRWLFVPENEIQAIEADNRTLPASDRRYQVLLYLSGNVGLLSQQACMPNLISFIDIIYVCFTIIINVLICYFRFFYHGSMPMVVKQLVAH